MDNEELLKKLASLPEPDFLSPGQIRDPIGSTTAYRANTVVRLIDEAVAAERERCAQVAEYGIAESDPGPYNNACRNIAAAIRGGSNEA
jgi:hypothetical protein